MRHKLIKGIKVVPTAETQFLWSSLSSKGCQKWSAVSNKDENDIYWNTNRENNRIWLRLRIKHYPLIQPKLPQKNSLPIPSASATESNNK